MCDALSWIEAKMPDDTMQVLFLKDENVYSSYGRDKFKDCQDNDYIGHGAIRAYFDLDTSPATLTQHENREFWNKENFPPEIARYLESPETFLNTWGKMIQTCFQPDDAYFVLTNAPKSWLSALLDIMVDRVATHEKSSYHALCYAKGLTEAQKDKIVDRVATEAEYSSYALRYAKRLTKIQKDKLVDRVATNAEYSYYALCYAKGLTKIQKDKLKKASKQT